MIDWRHWHNEPILVGGLILLGWLYAIVTGPLRPRLAGPGVPFSRRSAWCFAGSLVIFYLAVGSPLDQIGERFLFTAHMLQHQLLSYAASLLFLLGLEPWMVDPILGRRGIRTVARFLAHPLVAGFIYIIVTSLWHVPAAYDLALRDKTIHVVEHLMFFGAGLFYWWPLFSPSRVLPPVRYPSQILYMLYVVIGRTPVFAYVVFTPHVLYPTYEFAPRIIDNFSPMDDQLLAGSMMKIVGMSVALGAVGWSFYRWYMSKAPAETSDAQH